MEFLNYVGIPTAAVKVQSPVTLRITPGAHLGISPLQISLYECTVEPTQSKFSYAPLKIIENGCPADGVGLVDSIDIDQFGIAVAMGPLRYTDSAESLYKCKVRVCKVKCPTYSCVNPNNQRQYTSYGRRRRRRQNSARQFYHNNQPVGNSVGANFGLNPTRNNIPVVGQFPDGISGPLGGPLPLGGLPGQHQSLEALAADIEALQRQSIGPNWLSVEYRELVVEKRLIVLNSNIALQYYIRTGIIPLEEQPRR